MTKGREVERNDGEENAFGKRLPKVLSSPLVLSW